MSEKRPHRTRRRVLIGGLLPVERPDGERHLVRVTGMGWEGAKFVLHVVEVFS